MKKLLLTVSLLAIFAPDAAQAGGKWPLIGWWPSHWVDQDFKPYYQDGQLPHDSQWSHENWEKGDWVAQSGGKGGDLMQKFYNTRLIKGQEVEDGVPYLDIDVNFYHLSGFDKQRLAMTVDHIYGVTSREPRMFFLRDATTDKVIGQYTSAGLTLE